MKRQERCPWGLRFGKEETWSTDGKTATAKAIAVLLPYGMISDVGPSDRIRTCGIVVPNHARYQLRYTRSSSEETRSVPFPPGGENCTCAPSFFLSKSDPLRWAPMRENGEKKLAPFRTHMAAKTANGLLPSKPFYYTSRAHRKQEIFGHARRRGAHGAFFSLMFPFSCVILS